MVFRSFLIVMAEIVFVFVVLGHSVRNLEGLRSEDVSVERVDGASGGEGQERDDAEDGDPAGLAPNRDLHLDALLPDRADLVLVNLTNLLLGGRFREDSFELLGSRVFLGIRFRNLLDSLLKCRER